MKKQNRTKKELINELLKIKKELKLVRGNHKNRCTFVNLEDAEKKIRKVQTHIVKDSRGIEHIQCRINLPACYVYKKVIVRVVK